MYRCANCNALSAHLRLRPAGEGWTHVSPCCEAWWTEVYKCDECGGWGEVVEVGDKEYCFTCYTAKDDEKEDT
jgi:hypothetical protein